MTIPLPLHLTIHLTLAIIVGFLVGRYYKKPGLGIILGIIGGFLIDLDHVLEYFLVYGLHFNLLYFSQGREFLLSDKVHLWFHAWEYFPILLICAWIFRKKKTIQMVLVTLAFAGLIHLATDCLINHYPPKFYSLIYRAKADFSAQTLVSPADYQKNMELKAELGL
ncbi:MAG: hypothetical protein WC467_00540 [Patescibacteria group bacterium]